MTLPLPPGPSCAACGERIFWERTPDGRRICVDARSSADGTLEVRKGVAYPVEPLSLNFGVNRYHAHADTCAARKQQEKTA